MLGTWTLRVVTEPGESEVHLELTAGQLSRALWVLWVGRVWSENFGLLF